jgi:hypothetical protein
MNVQQLTELLQANSESSLRFLLPTGEFIPRHFHITEVGRVEKNFIDCGGTRRQALSCLLQVWTANDMEHRLQAGKLANIMNLAAPLLGSADLPVEVEYGVSVAAQYRLADVQVTENELRFFLVGKQTDCLAKDKCGVEPCSGPSCCC